MLGGKPMKCIGQVLKFGKKIQAFISQIMTRQIQIESEEFFVAAPLISRLWPFPCRLACPSLPCLPCSCPLPHSSTLFHTHPHSALPHSYLLPRRPSFAPWPFPHQPPPFLARPVPSPTIRGSINWQPNISELEWPEPFFKPQTCFLESNMKVSFKRVKRLPTEDFSSWQRKLDKKATFGNARRRCGKFSWKRQCFAIGTRRGQEGCVALAITSLLPNPHPPPPSSPMVRPAKRGQRGIGCPSPLSVLPQRRKNLAKVGKLSWNCAAGMKSLMAGWLSERLCPLVRVGCN